MDQTVTAPKAKNLLSKDGSVHLTDEVWNTFLSSLGAALSIIGLIFLISRNWESGSWHVLSLFVYGISLILMFASSALHHGIDGSPYTNHLLRQFDYFAISGLIAGTYTPFCFALQSTLGWIALGLVWALALIGIVLKASWPHVPRWIMTSLYIGMGWLGLLIARPVYQVIHGPGFFALVLGGLFFTVGGLIYALERPNLFPGRFGFHEIWHCFVLAGTASHFYVIYFYL